jgi:hypothetical protein
MREVLGHEITRSRKTAAEPIGVSFKAPNQLTLPHLIEARSTPRRPGQDTRAASRARLHSRRMGRPGKRGLPDQGRLLTRVATGLLIELATSSIS